MEAKDNQINYIEFQANDLDIKEFYTSAFNWTFTDYGPTYTAFSESGMQGGFEKTDVAIIKDQVIAAGGKISKDIFSFPGGRRFHFVDPSNNELAIWSDK
ncbi:MAG: VOC family protein [Crocinitomicaceae bacterium]|nr:VOC family protein [Crocinitomicaceae bacterium]